MNRSRARSSSYPVLPAQGPSPQLWRSGSGQMVWMWVGIQSENKCPRTEMAPWECGLGRGPRDSPSSLLFLSCLGAPVHQGAPGAQGDHARPLDPSLQWGPAERTGESGFSGLQETTTLSGLSAVATIGVRGWPPWPKPTNNFLGLKSSTAPIPIFLPADVTGNVDKMDAGGAWSLIGHDISPQNKTWALGQLSPHRAESQDHEQGSSYGHWEEGMAGSAHGTPFL